MANSRQRIVLAVETDCWPAFPMNKGRSERCCQMKVPLHRKALSLKVVRKSSVSLFLLVCQLGIFPDVQRQFFQFRCISIHFVDDRLLDLRILCVSSHCKCIAISGRVYVAATHPRVVFVRLKFD